MLHVVPLTVLTPANVRTLVWFMEMVDVNPRPSSAATLRGVVVPPKLNGPLDGITIDYPLE
jgi:hypothetical protein